MTASHEASRPFWPAAIVAVVAAPLATTAVAALGRAADISLDVDGEPIPLSGFPSLTVIAVLVGIGLALALRRWAGRPRRAFVTITVALLAVSFVPDLLVPDTDTSTRLLLVTAHLVAALIVIPTLAARLPHERS